MAVGCSDGVALEGAGAGLKLLAHPQLENEHTFATLPSVSGGPLPLPGHGHGPVLATERVLPVCELLGPLFPGAGIQRGSLVGVSGTGGTTLLLSLLVGPLSQGSWAAVVGLPDLGLEAAAAMGVDLGRIALVPDPGKSWTAVIAALLDALDLVVVRPPGFCRPGDARRLAARARERGSVLLVVGGGPAWPERPDLELAAETDGWEGLGTGEGTLRQRPARVVVSGRRGGRPRAMSCWLPGPDGRLASRRSRDEPTLEPVDELPERVAWAG